MTEYSAAAKVHMFRELTRGAEDVFARFAVGSRVGRAHWGPVYQRLLDTTIMNHLAGYIELGSYPMIPSADGWHRVHWICADFDGKRPMTDWRSDVARLLPFLLDGNGPTVFLNTSRSGQGAHVRLLFAEAVPAWLARRWFEYWLREAGLLAEDEWDIPGSFDRLLPPQDVLKGMRHDGQRFPGNLAGSPLHRGHAKHGGTMPLDPYRGADGDFEPDGKHWDHVATALESRSWGERELQKATAELSIDSQAPNPAYAGNGRLRVLPETAGASRLLRLMVDWCVFMQSMQRREPQSYHLWVAMASQLHRFGESGRQMFHEISSMDPRYSAAETERKWEDTVGVQPMRCDTLVRHGFTCPHLTDLRCNNARSPAFFGDYSHAE